MVGVDAVPHVAPRELLPDAAYKRLDPIGDLLLSFPCPP